MKAPLCMVGPFPPPRHGMSTVNEAFAAAAARAGFELTLINTAPASLKRSLGVLLGRWPKIWRAWRMIWAFGRRHPDGVFYCSLGGGLGLLYDAGGLALARMAGMKRLVLHHHSFRYINAHYWPMWLVAKIGGPGALHVVLGAGMAARLQARYPGIVRTLALSNAIFIPDPAGETRRASGKSYRVGYLSNLSKAKGLDDVLDTAGLCARQGLPVEFHVAGPFENPSDQTGYTERFERLVNVRYHGPVYNEAKSAFWQQMDAMVFPTRYRHEAEPLVVLEALSHGCPVIAYGRGCIPEMITPDCGIVVSAESDFAPAAVAALSAWQANPDGQRSAAKASRTRFVELRCAGDMTLQKLFKELNSPTASH